MHAIRAFCLAVAALAAAATTVSADPEVIKELQRKARAGEADGGYCASVAAKLETLDRQGIQARINQLLSKDESQGADLLFVYGEANSANRLCGHFVFKPAAMKDGKKCRDSETYTCVANGPCRFGDKDPICEKSPGNWD